MSQESSPTPIIVSTKISASIEKVWSCYTEPAHIVKWNFASDDWESPHAENDVKVGGKFKIEMSAKDKSAGFDFEGVYTNVVEKEILEYEILGGRKVSVKFQPVTDSVVVVTTFDPEQENSLELQQTGWQAILDNFKKYVESQT